MGMVTFHIFGTCHDIRISSDSDMILRSETEKNKRYTTTSKKSDTDIVMDI